MKIGVYPGTFDPITFGHLDIIVRAGKLFDKVIIAVAEDNTKNPIFNIEERKQFIEHSISELKNVEVSSFSGLLVNYAT